MTLCHYKMIMHHYTTLVLQCYMRMNKHSVLQFTGPAKKKAKRLLPYHVDINADLHQQDQDFTPVSQKHRDTCGHVSHVTRFASYICTYQVSFHLY